jgi:hypothetical protein
MVTNHLKVLLIFGSVISVVGLIVLLSSVNIGMSLSYNWLLSQGGSADSNTYNLVMESYISNFTILGGILCSFGLLTVVVSYYKWRLS